MLTHLLSCDPAGRLQHDIACAQCPTAELARAVLDLALPRIVGFDRHQKENHIRQLIASQAWTDSALALVALDRSGVLRQVIHEDGEWRCILGAVWPVPAWLDDTIEFRHPELPLAILGALVGALQKKNAPPSAATSVPPSRGEPCDMTGYVGCDNFA
jgi:hypothetical protein